MTDAAPEVSKEESRALWMEVVRWPLGGGMLGAVILFAVLAYASACFEGGNSSSQRDQQAWGQALVFFAAVVALGVYSWRAISCTYPAERRVPWLRDAEDGTPLTRVLGLFVSVLFLTFLPAAIWLAVRLSVHPAEWVDWLVISAACAYGAACLPLALAGAVVRGSPLAAMPGSIAKIRRADPRASRIASMTSVLFVACLILSFWLASEFVKEPGGSLVLLPGERARKEPDPVGPWLFGALTALRAAGFYAALVSFRVAGLLVREVPEIREAMK